MRAYSIERTKKGERKMAFFEQLGKKLSDAGQGVAQQTKKLAEITKINGQISEEEKKISRLYGEIGKAYYENHKEDPEAEELQSIQQITEAFAQIEQYRDQLCQVKGIAKCPNCGAEVPSESMFCNACGAKMPAPAPKETQPAGKFCPACGAPVLPENKFCNACGAKLSEETDEEAAKEE